MPTSKTKTTYLPEIPRIATCKCGVAIGSLSPRRVVCPCCGHVMHAVRESSHVFVMPGVSKYDLKQITHHSLPGTH